MNTLEVVLLSIMAGVLIALLIAATGYLAWMLRTVRLFLADVQAAADHATSDISLLRSQIDAILNTHRLAMDSVISKLNGDRLVEASNVIIGSAKRIETACVAFGELSRAMLSGDVIDPDLQRVARSGLGPESYAPNPTGERWVGQSRTAAQDSDELLREGVDNPEE